jgi:hypothetical protein
MHPDCCCPLPWLGLPSSWWVAVRLRCGEVKLHELGWVTAKRPLTLLTEGVAPTLQCVWTAE